MALNVAAVSGVDNGAQDVSVINRKAINFMAMILMSGFCIPSSNYE
jgi:hypothetical protein